jgi:hypothetical protein
MKEYDRAASMLNARGNWCAYYPHKTRKQGQPTNTAGAHGQTYKMQRAWAIATDNNHRGGFRTWSKQDHKS